MSVNIVVHDLSDGKARTIAWGVGLTVGVDSDGPVWIGGIEYGFRIKETYEDVMALVAAGQRKQARERIAAMALHGYLANPNISRWLPHEIAGQAVQSADALLAALDAKEGAE